MEELQAIKLLLQVLLGNNPLKLTAKPTLTTATQQFSPKSHATNKRVENGKIICSNLNNIKPASCKRVQQIIDTQLRKYPSPASTPTYDPTDDSLYLAYISYDSDSDSDDDSVAPFLNLPDNEDEPAPAPRYNFRSNHKVTSVNAAVSNTVQEAIRQCQLEVNPDIIPPLVIKEVSHLTRGYCQANELLQLSHWAW